MTKQPYLTSFPRTVLAHAARRRQAAIRRRRQELIDTAPSGYSVMFEEVLPGSFLKKIDPTLRQRHFGHLPTFWAWTAQIFEGNSSCCKGLGFIQSWCAGHGLPVPAPDNSAYCKARQRLCSEKFLHPIGCKVGTALAQGVGERDLWKGFTLKAIDGSTVKLMDTPANQDRYPQPCAQQPGCGFPVMGLAGLLNLSHGGWEAFHTGEADAHDLTMARPLLAHLGQGDLLLADRAYCSYRFLHALRERGAHAVIRLHQKREAALDWRKGRRLSPHERLVSWKRPAFSSVSGKITRQEWEALPTEMEVRLIRLGYQDRYGRKRKMTVVTTLTEAQLLDGIELHALYARRWEIELRLRDIKTTLGFEFLRVRTPEMAHKTLCMLQIAYNLLRVLMQQAAHHAGRPVGAISFKGLLDLVTTMHHAMKTCAGRPRKRRQRMHSFIALTASHTVGNRPFRTEPRAVKQRPKPFALLTSPRHAFIETPHRSTYKKSP